MHIFMTREALLARLKDRLALALKDDAKTLAEHAKEEQKALDNFKVRCRAALQWSYKQLKANGFAIAIEYGSRPDCPKEDAGAIKRAITEVTLDKRKDFTVTPNTNIHDAVNWLPRAERPKADMC